MIGRRTKKPCQPERESSRIVNLCRIANTLTFAPRAPDSRRVPVVVFDIETMWTEENSVDGIR